MHISHVNEAELKAYLAGIPAEDEELSPEELSAIAEGEEAAARGDVVSAATVAGLVTDNGGNPVVVLDH